MPALSTKYILCKILVSDSVLRKDLFQDFVPSAFLMQMVQFFLIV